MKNNELRLRRRQRRKAGIRKRVFGSPDQPRMCVHKSLKHTYVQIIDDLAGRTLVAASTLDKSLGAEKTGTREAAAAVGRSVAEKAKAAGIDAVVFDRNGFRFHGRVKAVADAAREGGLRF